MKALAITLFAASVLAAPARASDIVDLDVRDVRLAVNAKGEALVTYTRATGARRRLLLWGGVNALPPTSGLPQTRFRKDYTGGRSTYHRAIWRRFHNVCRPYTGPQLPWFVTGCTAPDGSHWVLQSWQRLLPMRGFDPWLPRQRARELHVSHWTGALPALDVSPNWTYGGSWQGLIGRMTYLGAPTHGIAGRPGSRYQRYAYIDTLDSAYGAGWRRDAAKALHVGNGAFCYSFVPQVPPPGYPSSAPRGPGNGKRHRVTVMGPGVTPILSWEGDGLAGYDAAQDNVFNALFDRIVGPADRVCRNER